MLKKIITIKVGEDMGKAQHGTLYMTEDSLRNLPEWAAHLLNLAMALTELGSDPAWQEKLPELRGTVETLEPYRALFRETKEADGSMGYVVDFMTGKERA
jgi:hypothetical protein